MKHLLPGEELPLCEIVARNYAIASDNRIHSDEVAALYGFAGGLVPGVGLYTYLTRPVIAALGRQWPGRGAMTAKFLKPVYDGETVRVCGRVTSLDPVALSLELFNPAGTLCAAGEARLPVSLPALDPADYPARALPEERLRPTIADLPTGLTLGSLVQRPDPAEMETSFLHDPGDRLTFDRDAEAICHPAFLPASANEILMLNVALGPWIHTASDVQHYSLARGGEEVSLRGKVAESFERRGHEFVVLDLAMFGADERIIARVRHTAIVRLRGA
jgi:hypothetical protein